MRGAELGTGTSARTQWERVAVFVSAPLVLAGAAWLPIYLSTPMSRSLRSAGESGDAIAWRPRWSSLFDVIEGFRYEPGQSRWPLIVDTAVLLGITFCAVLAVHAVVRKRLARARAR